MPGRRPKPSPESFGDELTEQLPSKADFQTLQSDFKTLEAKFDALEAKFDGLEAKFDGLEAKFNDLEGKFDTLERRFDALEGKFDTLERRFDALEGKFALHSEPRAGAGRAARGAWAHRADLKAAWPLTRAPRPSPLPPFSLVCHGERNEIRPYPFPRQRCQESVRAWFLTLHK